MKISEEMAVRLHRMMWSDMQKELGDNPSSEARKDYKREWITTHFPSEGHITNNCFLCEYTKAPWAGSQVCQECPIIWPGDTCCHPAKDTGVDYASSPISKILELPDRRTGVRYIDNNKAKTIDATSYFKFREGLLSKASGLPASSAIADHVKAIRKKASDAEEQMEALKQRNDSLTARYIAVKEYLANQSGLVPGCTVFEHVTQIREVAKKDGRMEKSENIYKALSEVSGLPKGNWCLSEHLKAIREKAVEEYFEKAPGAKLATMDVDQAFKQYAKEQLEPIFKKLAAESGLDATATLKAHINAIYSNGFDDGKDVERERILDKIGEILKK